MKSVYLTLMSEEDRLAYIMKMITEGPLQVIEKAACVVCGGELKRLTRECCSHACACTLRHKRAKEARGYTWTSKVNKRTGATVRQDNEQLAKEHVAGV